MNKIRKLKHHRESKKLLSFFDRLDIKKKIGIYILLITIIPATALIFYRSYSLKKDIYQEKETSLKYQTDLALSILTEYNFRYLNGEINNLSTAKLQCAKLISMIRYGKDNSNYFWIQSRYENNTPFMVMHPYFPGLNGSAKTEVDAQAFQTMKEVLVVVQEEDETPNEGFIEYQWPANYTETQHYITKLSFVKLFTPWDWILGTGIYIDDVNDTVRISLLNDLMLLFAIYGTLGVLVISLIIKELKNKQLIQTSLTESETKFNKLINNMNEGYSITNSDYEIIFVNSQFANIIGYTEKELIGQPVSKFMTQEEFEKMTNQQNSENRHKNRQYELQWIAKNGDIKDTLISPSRYYSKSGELSISGAIITDITEMKKIQWKLKKNQQIMKKTLDNLGEGVITVNSQGIIKATNLTAEILTGWPKQEVIDKTIENILNIDEFETGTHIQSITNDLLKPIQEKETPTKSITKSFKIAFSKPFTKPFKKIFLLYSRTNKKYTISLSIIPLRENEKDVQGFVMVFQDITKIKQYEDEFMKAQKMDSLGIMAGGIAHDFNNFLAAILGSISLLELGIQKMNDEDRELIQDIKNASVQAQNLTRQLLQFSKDEKPLKKIMAISEIVRKTANFAVRGMNTKCRFSFEENLPLVNIDEGQIGQVIQNLVLNGSQAMPQGGFIDINIKTKEITEINPIIDKPGQYIEIEIKDRGTGIPDKIKTHIFEPYFTTKEKGHGLGLAVCYKIIRDHEGFIRINSILNKGTSFFILLPCIRNENGLIIQHQKSPLHFGTGEIFILDDEISIQKILQKMLSYLGFTSKTFSNGIEIIAAYRDAFYEMKDEPVCILDLTIPGGKGGKEVFEDLKAINPKVRAIVASGYANKTILQNYKEFGFLGKLKKPFTLEDLSNSLDAAFQ
ncbi:MAG: PAS domain S-box protein [Promethearchaeota archaeon]